MKMQTCLSWALVIAIGGLAATKAEEPAPPESPQPARKIEDLKLKHDSFRFVRIRYSDEWRRSTWRVDYPEADRKFSERFGKVTGIKTEEGGTVLSLTDPKLKECPFIYLAEGGMVVLSEGEAVSLRKYLLGGGFLMVDDFWGAWEWEAFAAQMKKVFPKFKPRELPLAHPLFHCFYKMDEKPQVPSIADALRAEKGGVAGKRDEGSEAHYRGLFDGEGRLMAIFCHNTDLGDGWERLGESDFYDREYSLKRAYPMGINIVLYALGH